MTIGEKLDAVKLSHQKAFELRSSPYPLREFMDDLASGHITSRNLEQRMHFVCQSEHYVREEVRANVLEEVANGALTSQQVQSLEPQVVSALGLNLALR